MAGGLTLIPSYTQDQIFPAYQDRLLIKSLGVQAGVVGEEDFKVSAASGLFVALNKGKAFIEQTNAKQESSNVFYNGLYNVLSPTAQAPSNFVEVPITNPQIAQIILRVYDIEELGTTGSSFGRIEWLNGSPNAGATKVHVEEEKASEFGAAAMPTSSYRVAYVIVPKNATVSSEYEIFDARTFSNIAEWRSLVMGTKIKAGSGLYFSPQVRTENAGKTARLRGSIAVKTGETYAAGETLFTLPFLFPKSNKIVPIIITYLHTGAPIAGVIENGKAKLLATNIEASFECVLDCTFDII